jgi:hypothetical protein
MSEIIPPGVQSLMQAAVTTYNLPDTATIRTKQRTTTSSGSTVSYTVVGTTACRVGKAEVREVVLGTEVKFVTVVPISLPLASGVTGLHNLLINGASYDVIGRGTRGTRALAEIVLAQRIGDS